MANNSPERYPVIICLVGRTDERFSVKCDTSGSQQPAYTNGDRIRRGGGLVVSIFRGWYRCCATGAGAGCSVSRGSLSVAGG
jgi:hypothetical protein